MTWRLFKPKKNPLEQKLADQLAETARVAKEKQDKIDELGRKLAAVPVTVDLSKETPTAEALALVPRNVAVENNVLPLSVDGIFNDVLVLAMESPNDIQTIDNISSLSRKRIRPVLPIGSLSKAIQKAYGTAPTPTPTPTTTPTPTVKKLEDMSTDELRNLAQAKKTIVEILSEEKRNPGGATIKVAEKVSRAPQTVEEAWKVVDEWRRESFLKQIAGAEAEAEKIIHPPATSPKKEPELNICDVCHGPVVAPRKICFFCEGKKKVIVPDPAPVIVKGADDPKVLVVGDEEDDNQARKLARAKRQADKVAKRNGKGKGGKPDPENE